MLCARITSHVIYINLFLFHVVKMQVVHKKNMLGVIKYRIQSTDGALFKHFQMPRGKLYGKRGTGGEGLGSQILEVAN